MCHVLPSFPRKRESILALLVACSWSRSWLFFGERFVLLRRASHFSLRGQRELTKRKATPLPRLPGRWPGRYARGLRGLSTVHPATAPALLYLRHPCRRHGLTPNWPASMPATLRAFPPPGRRCRGEGRSEAARDARPGSAIAHAIAIAFALGLGLGLAAVDVAVAFDLHLPCEAVSRGRSGP